MNKNTILYSLNVQDAQTVSLEVIGRKLNPDEIRKIEDLIAQNIKWYDVIADAIHEVIDLNK
ncbi:MAG: hypothetical protein NT175_13900 [Bacteroidetes bacterium]|nr:hypothetical protein [Bacteroidota bacterium]